MPSQRRVLCVARPSFRESGAAVSDDVYPGTKHNGPSVCSLHWLEKRQAKLIIPIYFGTKTSKFCSRIISFSSLESELSFDSKDSEINLACVQPPVSPPPPPPPRGSATQCEITAWSFGSKLQYFERRRGRPLCGRAVCILGMES